MHAQTQDALDIKSSSRDRHSWVVSIRRRACGNRACAAVRPFGQVAAVAVCCGAACGNAISRRAARGVRGVGGRRTGRTCHWPGPKQKRVFYGAAPHEEAQHSQITGTHFNMIMLSSTTLFDHMRASRPSHSLVGDFGSAIGGGDPPALAAAPLNAFPAFETIEAAAKLALAVPATDLFCLLLGGPLRIFFSSL